MSGHSKWSNIKNRKGAVDKKRSEVFTRASKNIMTALRSGGGMALKTAIDQAKAVNMPRENIERLQNRYEEKKANLVYCRFEGFGPFSVPLVIEVETDNKNRTIGEIKLLFRDIGGSLGSVGCTGYMFSGSKCTQPIKLNSESEVFQVMDLIEALEGHDDVVNVFSGFTLNV